MGIGKGDREDKGVEEGEGEGERQGEVRGREAGGGQREAEGERRGRGARGRAGGCVTVERHAGSLHAGRHVFCGGDARRWCLRRASSRAVRPVPSVRAFAWST